MCKMWRVRRKLGTYVFAFGVWHGSKVGFMLDFMKSIDMLRSTEARSGRNFKDIPNATFQTGANIICHDKQNMKFITTDKT